MRKWLNKILLPVTLPLSSVQCTVMQIVHFLSCMGAINLCLWLPSIYWFCLLRIVKKRKNTLLALFLSSLSWNNLRRFCQKVFKWFFLHFFQVDLKTIFISQSSMILSFIDVLIILHRPNISMDMMFPENNYGIFWWNIFEPFLSWWLWE